MDENTCGSSTFQFGKMCSEFSLFPLYTWTIGIKLNAFRASQKVTEPVKGRDGLLSSCCSDCNSRLGSVKRGHPECAFLLRPFAFLSDPFNVLWAPVSGLKKALSTGRRCHSLCESCGFWIYPSVNTSVTSAHTLTVQRGCFSAYRKEMNSKYFAFSLPSFASCDDVCLPAALR